MMQSLKTLKKLFNLTGSHSISFEIFSLFRNRNGKLKFSWKKYDKNIELQFHI